MDKRLARLIKTIRGGQNEPVMLDTYNQAIHIDVACTIQTNINTANLHFIMEKIDKVGTIHKGQSGVVYGQDGIAPTCDTCQGGGRETKIVEPINYRIRKLTERECFRLMGVHDEDSDKIRATVSKSQCYKLAGNSIVVDVMVRIFDQLLFGNNNKNQQLEIF